MILGPEEDAFFVDLQSCIVIWIYYNPDSVAGGQFVINTFYSSLLEDALQQTDCDEDASVVEFLEERCNQELADVGTELYDCVDRVLDEKEWIPNCNLDTLEQIDCLLKAADAIQDFCVREYHSSAELSDWKKISLAYTTTENGKHEIQVYANLKDCCLETHLDGECIITERFKNIQEMLKKGLKGLCFDELVSIPNEVLKDYDVDTLKDYLAAELVWFNWLIDPADYECRFDNGQTANDVIAEMRASLDKPQEVQALMDDLNEVLNLDILASEELEHGYDLMEDLSKLQNTEKERGKERER